MALTHILKPIEINGCHIKNRAVRAAHATNLGGGAMSDALIQYHVARGRGGVGLSIVEILGIHWSTPATVNAFLPGIEDGYCRLVEQVRPSGMKLFQQLWHAGHNTLPMDGSPPWSASDTPGFMAGVPAIPMTKMMIDEIVGAYAETARRCETWGLDGVEVHAAHGYLPAQFLSSATNHRQDDYGGAFENRVRFLLETMRAVRGNVSKSFPVGIRLAPDGLVGGLGVEENLRAAVLLIGENLIDYVNISLGNYQTWSKMIGGMHEPAGYEMPTSVKITAAVDLPTIVTGRFRTLEEGDQIIRAGEASMVSFVRAMIADPDLVAKTVAGHAEQVRPCIACNQGCLGAELEPPFRMGCTVNPGVGFEATLGDHAISPAANPKRVLVVGGGAAGMEAARVARLRGHRVTLVEATAALGGALIAASRAPTRQSLLDIVIWLEQEIYRLGVEVRMSTYLEPEDIDAEEWDVVIVAAGSTPRMDGWQSSNPGELIEGIELPHVISSRDLLLDNRKPSRHAVVLDDAGHYEGVAAAEYLASRGADVTFVTRHISIAAKMEGAQMVEPALTRLADLKFVSHVRTRAVSIDPEWVAIAPIYLPSTSSRTLRVRADTVVVVSLNRANRDLFDLLSARGIQALAIGDSNAARQLPTAIREGHMAGASI